jgi:hypothetical protein
MIHTPLNKHCGLLQDVLKECFNPQYGLIATNEQHQVYPNPDSLFFVPEALSHFEFAGKMLAKNLYEHQLVSTKCNFFFKKKKLHLQEHFAD